MHGLVVQLVREAAEVVLQPPHGLVAEGEEREAVGEVAPLAGGVGARAEAVAELLHQGLEVLFLKADVTHSK